MIFSNRSAAYVAIVLSMAGGVASADESIRAKALVAWIDDVEVAANDGGDLRQLDVQEGQVVRAGQVLAILDDTEARLRLNRARLDLAHAQLRAADTTQVQIAEKAWEVAKSEYRRAADSAKRYSKSISATEIDRLQLAVDQAALRIQEAKVSQEALQIELEQQQAVVAEAEHKLEQRTLRAPMAGSIAQVHFQRGERVQLGENVVRIVNREKLRAEAFLPAEAARQQLTGRKALVIYSTQDPAESVPATIEFVSPELTAVDGKLRVWAEFENPNGRLRPGMDVQLVIE